MQFELISPRNESLSVVEQVFQNRGVKGVSHYLNTTEEDIHSPLLLDNIVAAANLLKKHIEGDGLIYVQIDSDNDGLASSALLLNYLHRVYPEEIETRFYWGLHEGKQHGIDVGNIADGVTLVICPDAGTNELELHQMLNEVGIDVLILDHHKADVKTDFAVVVNNQMDNYPNKTLCGAAIVWKFCQYLEQMFQVPADDYRDLAAWAIVADMMDLRDYETRQILNTGFKNIKNLFFGAMIEKASYSLGGQITPHGIAFYITPLVNAVMRVGTMEEKQLLFNAMLDWKALEEVPSTKRGCKGEMETILEQAVRMCTNVKNRQSREEEKSLEQIMQLIESTNALAHKIILLQIPGEPDPNLLGLNANKIMAKYQRPVILLRLRDEEKDEWTGSARGVNGSRLADFRTFCLKSGMTTFAEGHSNAFGISLAGSMVPRFLDYADNMLADMDFSPAYKVDFIYQGGDFKANDIRDLAKYKYIWGQEIGEPNIAVTNLSLHKGNTILMSPDKKPTIKIILPNGVECIKFKSSAEEYATLLPTDGCTHINLIGTCDLNVYYGKETPQILIKDYEITNVQDYYF